MRFEKYRSGMLLLVCFFAVMLWGSPVFSHRVIVFAWIEGDTVRTISKFPGGRKVSNGNVTVYDDRDTPLLEGKTNEAGEFSFPIPKISPLKIVLSAGPGHQGQWRLSEAEIRAALAPDESQRASQTEATSAEPDIPPPGSHESKPEPFNGKTAKEDIAAIVEEAVRESLSDELDRKLEQKLAPVMRQLADLQNKGPTPRDIFGGIGYILGLFGIAAYVYSRRQ